MKRTRRITIFIVMALLVAGISASSALPALACDGDCGCPPKPKCYPVGTPGYWMNHPDAWPVSVIEIGGVTYSKAKAIEYIEMPVKGDKTLTMFPALVAAKLNVLNNKFCWEYVKCVYVPGTLEKANMWMGKYPPDSGVKGSSDAWQNMGEALYLKLDAYNNGKLCAPARD